MKKVITFVLIMMLSFTALADIVTVNIETATLEEINEALAILTAERNARLLEAAKAIEPDTARNGILFRNIPWHSTKNDVDAALGISTYYHQDLQMTPEGSVCQGIGASVYCSAGELYVAGYSPAIRMYYVFPVIDGTLIRDKEVALFYLAEYEFLSADFGNIVAIRDDLSSKLSKLYGLPEQDGDVQVWIDEYGNQLRFIYSNRLTLRYSSHDADAFLETADIARNNENAVMEEALRAQNAGNYDGL